MTTRRRRVQIRHPDPLVACLLDKLPHKADGTAVTHWRQRFLPLVGWSVPEAVYGPAEPLAAKLAVEALRWLAAEANRDDEPGIAGWLNAVEDGIALRHPDAAP
jgi:hypothetical protein